MVTSNLAVVMVENIMPIMPKNDLPDACRTPTTPSMNLREKNDRHSQVIEVILN